MTRLQRRAAALERDRGLQRLRSWTVGCVLAAAGLVGFFAVLAAGSIPGRATASATPGGDQTPSQNTSQNPIQAQQPDDGVGDVPTPPPSGFFGRGGGGPARVASGSS